MVGFLLAGLTVILIKFRDSNKKSPGGQSKETIQVMEGGGTVCEVVGERDTERFLEQEV